MKAEKKEATTIRKKDLNILSNCLGHIKNTEDANVLDIVKIVKLKNELKEHVEEYAEVQKKVLEDAKVDMSDEKSLNSEAAKKAFKKLDPISDEEITLENVNFMSAEDVIKCTKGTGVDVLTILLEYVAKDA